MVNKQSETNWITHPQTPHILHTALWLGSNRPPLLSLFSSPPIPSPTLTTPLRLLSTRPLPILSSSTPPLLVSTSLPSLLSLPPLSISLLTGPLRHLLCSLFSLTFPYPPCLRGHIVAALLEELHDLKGQACFENCATEFGYSLCIRQGSALLWRKIAKYSSWRRTQVEGRRDATWIVWCGRTTIGSCAMTRWTSASWWTSWWTWSRSSAWNRNLNRCCGQAQVGCGQVGHGDVADWWKQGELDDARRLGARSSGIHVPQNAQNYKNVRPNLEESIAQLARKCARRLPYHSRPSAAGW